MSDNENKNNNDLTWKIGASIAGVAGISLLTYLIWDFFGKKKQPTKKGSELKESVKLGQNEQNELLEDININNSPNQTNEEFLETQFREARMDTLVQEVHSFPTKIWDQGKIEDWKETRNQLFKRCYCGKNANKVKVLQCGNCKAVFYCSRDHQKESWTVRGHKNFCSKLSSASNLTFSGFKRLLIENSPPINRSEFATEDSLSLVLKRLFDEKFENEVEEATLLKEIGRLSWMLAQIKYNNKPNMEEFNNMMKLSKDYLNAAWSKQEALKHDLELKAQTEWLLGEHYMTQDIGKGCYLMLHSVQDMLTFHSNLHDKIKIEETKKLLQIWISALVERLMQGDFIDQAKQILLEILKQAEVRQDIEWQLQTMDMQCLVAAYVQSKEKNVVVDYSNTSNFVKDMHQFYEEIKRKNHKIIELENKLKSQPPSSYPPNQQFSQEQFELMMKDMMKNNN